MSAFWHPNVFRCKIICGIILIDLCSIRLSILMIYSDWSSAPNCPRCSTVAGGRVINTQETGDNLCCKVSLKYVSLSSASINACFL